MATVQSGSPTSGSLIPVAATVFELEEWHVCAGFSLRECFSVLLPTLEGSLRELVEQRNANKLQVSHA